MSNYFNETTKIYEQIINNRGNGKALNSEELAIVNSNAKGAFHQTVIQGILAMSEEELTALKSEYCSTLTLQARQYQNYAQAINKLIGVYSSLTPEEFRTSMLKPDVLGIAGMTDLKKFAIDSASYIRNGKLDADAVGMDYIYSDDDIRNPRLSEAMQDLIKKEAEQRAQDIKEKLDAGMSLNEAVNSELGYRNNKRISK